MLVLTRPPQQPGGNESWAIWCPACREAHVLYAPTWNWNRNESSPSFWPSFRLVRGNGCHFVIGSGQIQYCGDSRHEFAGKTVPMVNWDEILGAKTMSLHTINGQPVEETKQPAPASATAAPAAPAKQTHKPECGEVGKTGEHGDLGSNAA